MSDKIEENNNDENINENEIEKPGKKLSAYRNISYSKRDIFYRKAKEEGFRARSVYKLKEIHYNYNILSQNSSKFVDLCAAPGSWTQMLRILTKSNKNAKIVSVDIQDIVPIEGVTIIKGDITRQDTIEKILSNFNDEKIDVVIFDGAPDVTGLIDVDMYMQVELIIFALVIVMKLLKKGGTFVAKMFKVGAVDDMKEIIRDNLYAVKSDFYYEKVKILFDNVFYFKPSSSSFHRIFTNVIEQVLHDAPHSTAVGIDEGRCFVDLRNHGKLCRLEFFGEFTDALLKQFTQIQHLEIQRDVSGGNLRCLHKVIG